MKYCSFAPSRLLVALFVTLLLLLVVIVSSAASHQENSEILNIQSSPPGALDTEDPIVSAIVVVRAASGHSYMADRDLIASMPELKTQEEIESFVARYEPLRAEQDAVRENLEQLGLETASQDNIFLLVSGRVSMYQKFIPQVDLQQVSNLENQSLIFTNNDLSRASNQSDLIEGVVMFQSIQDSPFNHIPAVEKSPPLKIEPSFFQSSYYDASYNDMVRALKIDRIHVQGITGKGVRIGFIDDGVFSGHQFFTRYPVDMRHYRFVEGKVLRVGINFDPDLHTNHGTAVASFLAATAPDASLLSFSVPVYDWEHSPDNYLAGYLSFLNQYDLIDILSLSRGIWEENANSVSLLLPEVRTQFINLISKKTVILVAAGNTPQCDYFNNCSGHNAFAAIPEVIAVGGSSLVPVGSSFIFSAAPNAASFNSSLFPGRAVPDIVGIYGRFFVPNNENGYSWGSGTSFATPQIAGMVALLKQLNPGINQLQVKTVLINNTFDIIDGENYHGVSAGPGYDLPTGHGQPLAHWVTQETMILNAGLNLIGITKDSSYTGVSLLKEIYAQGGDCDLISYFDGKYEGVMVKPDGSVYGWDFDVTPELGYWVRCWGKSFWRQSGDSYIDHEIPLDMWYGWNLVSIPYSSGTCTTKQLYSDTQGKCTRVVEYDSQLKEYQQRLIGYGNNFTLNPGKGYFVLCEEPVTWTPTCTDSMAAGLQDVAMTPTNVFEPRASTGIDRFASIDTANLFLQLDEISAPKRIDITVEDGPHRSEDNPGAYLSLDSSACSPLDIEVTNINDQSFSVSWVTAEPCPGTLFVTLGDGNLSPAFDDRGKQYSGLTHHITVRGLEAETQYHYYIDTGADLWGHYSVKTGTILRENSMAYLALGQVLNSNMQPFEDSMVYVSLSDGSRSSSKLSFPMSEYTEGFSVSLGNARNADLTAYYPYSSATKLSIKFQGGILEGWDTLNVDLNASPEVLVPDFNLGDVPKKPSILSPTASVMTNTPTFRFVSEGDYSQNLHYRLELSRDNFSTIEYIFDQRVDSSSWSAGSYEAGDIVSFKIPVVLDNFSGYQWRVFVFDNNTATWSSSSEIQGFSIVGFNQYLPFLSR